MAGEDLQNIISYFELNSNKVSTKELQEKLQFSSDKIHKWVLDGDLVRLERGQYSLSDQIYKRFKINLPQGTLRLDKQTFEFPHLSNGENAEKITRAKIVERASRDNLLIKKITFNGNRYDIEFLPARYSVVDNHLVFDSVRTPDNLIKKARAYEGAGRWELGRYFRNLVEAPPKNYHESVTEVIAAIKTRYGNIGRLEKLSEHHRGINPVKLSSESVHLNIEDIRLDPKTGTYHFGDIIQKLPENEYRAAFTEISKKLSLNAKKFASMTFKRGLPAIGIGLSIDTIAKADDKFDATLEEASMTLGGFGGGLTGVLLAAPTGPIGMGIFGAIGGIGGAILGGNSYRTLRESNVQKYLNSPNDRNVRITTDMIGPPFNPKNSSSDRNDQSKNSYHEPIARIKKLIDKASRSTGNELIRDTMKIEHSMVELGQEIPVNNYLTDSEINQLKKILGRTERLANQQIINSVETFVDDVNVIFDRNHFNYRYKVQHPKNHNPTDLKVFDPIPILHTTYNVFSFIDEKEAHRLAAHIISGSQILHGIPETVSAFKENGVAGIFSSDFASGSENFLMGFGNLLKLFGKQKNPYGPIPQMIQGVSNQIARLHEDVLEGFRQVFLAQGLMNLRMGYGFQNLELLAKQQHSEAMIVLRNMQTFFGIDRIYLHGLSESVKRIELGLNIYEIDKEDWSADLAKIDNKMSIYREEGINRLQFYNILIDLTELLQHSRIKAINRAKKLNLNSYDAYSHALSTHSSSLGTQHSGHFEDITVSTHFRSIAEQQINVILNFVINRYQTEVSLSKKIEAIKNPSVPLYPIEQFNPTALSEITQEILKLISIYKKGVFCPSDLTQNTHPKNCRLNKIEVLERLKQIQQYYKNYDNVIELFSDLNLIKLLVEDYISSYQEFNAKARKLLVTKLQNVYQEDMTSYYNRLEKLLLDLKLQQSLSLDIGLHISCPYPSLDTTFHTFSHSEWVGLWSHGWRGRGWGVACENWAPCGSWHETGTLINISKQRYIHDRKQAYHAELQKQIDRVEMTLKSRNQQNLTCHNIYFSANLTSSNQYTDCMPQIYFAQSSNPKLFNGKKIILPTDQPWIKYYIPEEIRRYLIPGFSWLDSQLEVYFEIKNEANLRISPIWRNSETNDSYPFPTLEYKIPVHPPLGPEEAVFYYWFGGDKPTGSCVEYDEGLRRPSDRGDMDAVRHYSEKLVHGTNWPSGNLVYTGGPGPGEQWMRLLFLRPATEIVPGVLNNPKKQPDAAYHFSDTTFDKTFPLMKKKTEQFLIKKRITVFKDYLMHLLLPDSTVHSSITTDESRVRTILIELDMKAKLIKAILSLVVDFTTVNMDPLLMSIFDKDNIIAYLNRYNGSLRTLFDQNDLNIKNLPTLIDKISHYFSKRGNVPFKQPLIERTKRELDELISIEEDHSITPLEEAIYPGTEKEIVDNLNPLSVARAMASSQMASELVKRNPDKLSYLKPMLMHTNKIISDTLGLQNKLLDKLEGSEDLQEKEKVNELHTATLITSDADISPEEPTSTSKNDKSTPAAFFGIPMANAEEITNSNSQKNNIVPPDISSATKRYGIPILTTIASFIRPRTPSLFVKNNQPCSKRKNVFIKSLPLDKAEIQDFDSSFEKDIETQIQPSQNEKVVILGSEKQKIHPEKCGIGHAYVITNKVTGASVVRMEGDLSYNAGTGKNLIFVGPNSKASIKGFKSEDHIAVPISNRHDGLPECMDVHEGSVLSVENEKITVETDQACNEVLPQIQPVSRNNPAEHFKAEIEFLKTPFFHSSLFLHGLACIAAFREEIADALLLKFCNGDQKRYASWQKGIKEFREKNAVKLGSDLSEMAARISIAKDLQVTENTTHIAKDFMKALITAKQEPKVYLGLLARAVDEAALILDKAIPYVSISGITQILTKTYEQYVRSSSKIKAAHTLVDNLPLLIPGSRVLLDTLDNKDNYLNKARDHVVESVVELISTQPAFGLRRRRVKSIQ